MTPFSELTRLDLSLCVIRFFCLCLVFLSFCHFILNFNFDFQAKCHVLYVCKLPWQIYRDYYYYLLMLLPFDVVVVAESNGRSLCCVLYR